MKTGRAWWGTAARLIICIGLLAFAFHSIFIYEAKVARAVASQDWEALSRGAQWRLAWTEGPRHLVATIGLLRPGDGLLSLLFMGLTILLGLLRWHMFLGAQGLGLSLVRTAEISLVAHFFNSFLLGSAGGDLMKALYAARETHHLKAESVMTVVVDRLVGLFTTLFFAALMMLLHQDLVRAHGRLAAAAGFVLGALGIVAAVAALSFWGGLSRVWPGGHALLRRLPKGELLERSLVAARVCGRRPGLLLGALGLSLLLNLACVMQVWALARGLGLSVSLPWLLVIVPVVIFLSSIPITPNGLGVRENLYVWMLAGPVIGVPATGALTLSLLAFGGSLVWSLVGGVVYVGFRKQHHLAEVAHEVPEADATNSDASPKTA